MKVSQEAFAVFCDYACGDAATKNEKMRAENETLRASRDLLLQVQVKKKALDNSWEILGEANLMQETGRQEDESYLVLDLDRAAELPIAGLGEIVISISGVDIPNQNFSSEVSCGDDGDIVMEFSVTKQVIAVGGFRNFTGSLHDVFGMAANALFGIQEGPPFLLRKIKISKEIVQPVLDMAIAGVDDLVGEDSIEIHKLASIDKQHEGLSIVLSERKELVAMNNACKTSRNLLGKVEVRFPGEGFAFRLEDGNALTFPVMNGQEQLYWVINTHHIPAIPLTSISKLQFSLANVSLTRRNPDLVVMPLLREVSYSYVVVRFGGRFASFIAVFALHGLDDFDPENEEIVGRINHDLSNAIVHGRSRSDAPETARLIGLLLLMDNVKHQLEALGVEVLEEQN